MADLDHPGAEQIEGIAGVTFPHDDAPFLEREDLRLTRQTRKERVIQIAKEVALEGMNEEGVVNPLLDCGGWYG